MDPSSWYGLAHNWRMRTRRNRALADEMKPPSPTQLCSGSPLPPIRVIQSGVVRQNKATGPAAPLPVYRRTSSLLGVREHDGQALAYVDTYRSNCNVKLTAIDRLKPSSSAKSHVGSITLSPLRSQRDATE